ncbi:aldehyde ferredoxin oxidoreductase [Candidatus Desulfosporosinus infrequens]|uniref:Aldehyde ferredoxin oxidoreductase n=1 Tax=Candidatus Desulfosporosinus infrequens TaxID=2043169 RepID=A0A2U3JWT0_9FIRM|nr:aldehyde ferredoxin oxidoreductase [Candidatus Desulfosporosinus infrequens]
MGGYTGKILRINLTARQANIEYLNVELASRYLSGRGLAGKILADEVSSNVDALSPENKLFFAPGVLTGTNVPTSRRFMAVTKSPLNGRLVFSNFGGYWGSQLKFAGYDMVILEGKAEHPVYIVIQDNLVEIKDAAHVWGKDAFTAADILKKEIGDQFIKILTIGPAGEKLSLLAMIINDLYRAAGRNGVGTVMGSKNIKAIMVRGTGRVETADPVELKRVLTDTMKKIKGIEIKTHTHTQTAKHRAENDACYQCPIACEHYSKSVKGEGADLDHKCPEALGSDLGIYDDVAIQEAHDLCNKLGLDQISVSSVLATGIELAQRGYIRSEELDGIPLEFGNTNGMLDWIHKIAYSEGLGFKMGLGSDNLAKSYGASNLSRPMKKQKASRALGDEDKTFQDLSAVIDSLGLCLFTSRALGLSDYTEIVNAVIGSKYTNEDLLTCGERIWNNERLYDLSVDCSMSEESADFLPQYYIERGWDETGVPMLERLNRLRM